MTGCHWNPSESSSNRSRGLTRLSSHPYCLISLTIRPEECKRHTALLELYLLRSGSAPLCIILQDGNSYLGDVHLFRHQALYRNDIQHLMRVAVSKREHCEHIRIQILVMEFGVPMLASPQLALYCAIYTYKRATAGHVTAHSLFRGIRLAHNSTS